MTVDLNPRQKRGTLAQTISDAMETARQKARLSVKEFARVIGRTPKGAERVLSGDNSPQLDAIVAACREFDDVWETFCQLCGRDRENAEAMLDSIAAALEQRKRQRAEVDLHPPA